MTTTKETAPPVGTSLSAGAGIAIAGIWLATASLSICIILVLFVWNQINFTNGGETDATSAFIGVCILVLFIAAPIMAAYSITKKIIGVHT